MLGWSLAVANMFKAAQPPFRITTAVGSALMLHTQQAPDDMDEDSYGAGFLLLLCSLRRSSSFGTWSYSSQGSFVQLLM